MLALGVAIVAFDVEIFVLVVVPVLLEANTLRYPVTQGLLMTMVC
jgi:hypothetical protein